MSSYFGLLCLIVCIIHNQEAKLIEKFQEENVIVVQLQNDGKGKWICKWNYDFALNTFCFYCLLGKCELHYTFYDIVYCWCLLANIAKCQITIM